MAHGYYGDKLSPNMTETPEGYLICLNVPVGRIGSMDYYGNELPSVLDFPPNKIVKVYRRPEELFSEATMGSFEGKPVTNLHPSNNVTIETAPMIERGHAQNIRREGDFLLADLVITDAGLKDDILSGRKREISCGYDCLWMPMEDGTVEQREIVGNHVAIVENGRAGARVSIKDAKPDKPTERSNKRMKNPTKSVLMALGFKSWAQDAEPEEIAKAMDEMSKGEETQEPEKPVKDEEPAKSEDPAIKAELDGLKSQIADLIATVKSLVQSDKEVHKEFNAEEAMDTLESEIGKEETKAEDAKPEDEETKEDEDKETAEEQKKEDEDGTEKHFGQDAAPLRKFVGDMKAVILAIPDEKARNEAAKKLISAVKDARSVGAKNGYADILSTVTANKKAAMDQSASKRESMDERAQKAVIAWKDSGDKQRGGNR